MKFKFKNRALPLTSAAGGETLWGYNRAFIFDEYDKVYILLPYHTFILKKCDHLSRYHYELPGVGARNVRVAPRRYGISSISNI
jgi:hypothetical protein